MNGNSGSLLKAAGLWRRTSARGNEYFAGRLGVVKVVILENRDRTSDQEPTHFLFFADGQGAPKSAAAEARPPASKPARAKPVARTRRPSSKPAATHDRPFDDPLDVAMFP